MAQAVLEKKETAMQDVQEFSVEELTQHPDKLLNLFQDKNSHLSMYIRKEGEHITVSKKQYSREALDILKAADQELEQMNKDGYTEEEARKDFLQVYDEINEHLKNNQ